MSSTSATAAPTPTLDSERLDILDALRGFSLAGIFLLNLASFTGFAFMTPEQMSASPTASVDLPVAGLIVWLGYGKFYSLFSLLFGVGFSLQLAAAERRGDDRLAVFRRRLLVLMTIGAVHLYLWEGDILVLYAIMGFFLIPFRRIPDSRLLRASAALVLAPVVLEMLIVASGGRLDPGAPLNRVGQSVLVANGFSADALPYPFLRDAGWMEYLRFQLSGVFFRYGDLLTTGRPFKVLAMFVLGLYVGRSGLLMNLTPWIPTLRRVRRWAFAIGLPAALAQAVFLHWRNGQQPVAQDRRVARLRARGRAACDWICDDVCDPVAIEHVARAAFAPRARRTPGADELLVADRVCAGGVLRNRAWADGPRRPGLVAAHCRRRHHHAAGLQPMVAGAFCVRATGVALAASNVRTATGDSSTEGMSA